MNKGRVAIAATVWIVIVLLLAMGWKWIIRPHHQQQQQLAEQQHQDQILNQTSGSSRYDSKIDFAIDSFCGFAALRSDKFSEEMAKHRIKINLLDDGADYAKRTKAFKNGEVQMGVFTLDALIKAAADTGGTPPATVVAFVDETRGADAILAYKDVFPNIDSLNFPDVKFIRPDGPSDTLTRVLMSHFRLNNVSQNSFIPANDAADVYDRYKKSKPDARQAYVLWEPFVSKMLENPNVSVIVDSSRFHGYIMDVIVANRDFLYKNPDQVEWVLEAYFKSLYQSRDSMSDLLIEDGKRTNQPLSPKDAKRIADGIWWKNTSDNYAQMGVEANDNVQHVADMISNITHVLITTGALQSDPTNGKANLLYYDGVLRGMHDRSFYPGVEKSRDDKIVLVALDESQWKKLMPVGRLNVPALEFGRGTADLSQSSQVKLDELIEKLKTWPQFYLQILGKAKNVGDAQANKDLAQSRAQAAFDYLTQHGVDVNRVHVSSEVANETAVNFIFGQPPF